MAKSHRLISGGEKLMGYFIHIVIYEMHDLGCIELTLILFVGFAGNLWIRC